MCVLCVCVWISAFQSDTMKRKKNVEEEEKAKQTVTLVFAQAHGTQHAGSLMSYKTRVMCAILQ